jgi:thiazole biosynthesis enzyme
LEKSVSKSIISGYTEKLSDALDLDVAIVGAGPSGLVCGYVLAGQGHKVAVFERKLAPGGGIWGGAMLFNVVVVQEECAGLLDEFGIRHSAAGDGLLSVDSVEMASALIYKAVNAGVRIFNTVTVEDVVYKNDRVGGVVVNWTPVLLQNMHVDPLVVVSKAVLDATGHGALLTEKLTAKTGIKLDTPSGGIEGERPMWAELGETATVENTKEVYPGLFVSGMAANAVYGSARMGPVFGGMLRSGQRAAEVIASSL